MFFLRRSITLAFFLLFVLPTLVLTLPLRLPDNHSQHDQRDYDHTIQTVGRLNNIHQHFERDGVSGTVGLGDNIDLIYTVPIKLGDTVASVQLDTGSSDLWVISDACHTTSCQTSKTNVYPSTSLVSSGADVDMKYGDSQTGTYAAGPIGKDDVTLAGVSIPDQQFAAINATTNTIVQWGAGGILGLGFPTGSVIQSTLVKHRFNNPGNTDSDHFLAASASDGPVLSRMAMSGELEQPMFAVTLQRNTVDISGRGALTIGKLPDGIKHSSLTWVPVRLYTPTEGGLAAPSYSPDEVFPSHWEIEIDDVYMDGQLMPKSTIPGRDIDTPTVSALIDTGNSLIRGPSDVVTSILDSISPSHSKTNVASFPCSTPHTLAFKIGGKNFSVDPQDFVGRNMAAAETCVASNIVATDPPRRGAAYSWSLGDPFLKSNLVAFYFGNLTHPSVDPPRIGFLSTVPENANSLYEAAVAEAEQNGGFDTRIDVTPTEAAGHNPATTVVPKKTHAASGSTSQTDKHTSHSSQLSVEYRSVLFPVIGSAVFLLNAWSGI